MKNIPLFHLTFLTYHIIIQIEREVIDMNRRVLASYNIGDSVWFVHDNKCEFASIKEVLKKDNYIIITTDMNTHTVNNKELYEYRSRIDLEFKRLEEVNEFVNRRFYDCC